MINYALKVGFRSNWVFYEVCLLVVRIFCTLIFLSNDNKIATEEDSTIFKNKKSQGQEHIDLELNIDYDSNYDDRKEHSFYR